MKTRLLGCFAQLLLVWSTCLSADLMFDADGNLLDDGLAGNRRISVIRKNPASSDR
jgi:hypothetical protein